MCVCVCVCVCHAGPQNYTFEPTFSRQMCNYMAHPEASERPSGENATLRTCTIVTSMWKHEQSHFYHVDIFYVRYIFDVQIKRSGPAPTAHPTGTADATASRTARVRAQNNNTYCAAVHSFLPQTSAWDQKRVGRVKQGANTRNRKTPCGRLVERSNSSRSVRSSCRRRRSRSTI